MSRETGEEKRLRGRNKLKTERDGQCQEIMSTEECAKIQDLDDGKILKDSGLQVPIVLTRD